MAEDKNELNAKVSQMEGILLYISTQMKRITLHFERIEEQSRKLSVGNEVYWSLKGRSFLCRCTRSALLASERSVKATYMVMGNMEEQYVRIGRHI